MSDDPFRRILEELPLAVFVLDSTGKPFFANRAARQLLGQELDAEIQPEELARSYRAFVAGTDLPYPVPRMPVVRALAGEQATVNDMVLRSDHRELQIEVWAAPIRGADGAIRYAAAAFNDISHQRELERRVGLDDLTGLGNKAAMKEALARAVNRLERSTSVVAVLFLDLNDFKPVNDRFGHQVGDEVLAQVAHRIRSTTRKGEQAFRVGGDEFVLVCEDLPRPEDAECIGRRLRKALGPPFVVQGHTMALSATVGIATTGSPRIPIQQLLELSDADMYRRKSSRVRLTRS